MAVIRVLNETLTGTYGDLIESGGRPDIPHHCIAETMRTKTAPLFAVTGAKASDPGRTFYVRPKPTPATERVGQLEIAAFDWVAKRTIEHANVKNKLPRSGFVQHASYPQDRNQPSASRAVTVFNAAPIPLHNSCSVRAFASRRNSLTLLHIFSIGFRSGL